MRLIINTGSTSKKYALFSGAACVLTARFEMVGDAYQVTYSTDKGTRNTEKITEQVYTEALRAVFDTSRSYALIRTWDDVTGIGIRVVAPGTAFAQHTRIDDVYLEALADMRSFAPLHISPVLQEIQTVRHVAPTVPIFAVSDSAFHATIPEYTWRYSIDAADADTYDIRRFGYHGISVSSILQSLPHWCEGVLPRRIIVCHFGGGASITAIKDGISIDTSMGFSPASGLHMNTRAGDIDAGALIYLAERTSRSLASLRQYINVHGGLKGVTNGIADMRDILDGYAAGNEACTVALHMYAQRVRKYIGGYIAALGGLDTIVLTATAAERNAVFRQHVVQGLDHLNITIDDDKNNALTDGEAGFINKDTAGVGIVVLPTDELGEMNRIMTTMQ